MAAHLTQQHGVTLSLRIAVPSPLRSSHSPPPATVESGRRAPGVLGRFGTDRCRSTYGAFAPKVTCPLKPVRSTEQLPSLLSAADFAIQGHLPKCGKAATFASTGRGHLEGGRKTSFIEGHGDRPTPFRPSRGPAKAAKLTIYAKCEHARRKSRKRVVVCFIAVVRGHTAPRWSPITYQWTTRG